MDLKLTTLATVLSTTEERLRAGRHATERIWPTGFGRLDPTIGGGLRAGGLTLLAGPQGLGKTTFALQACRNVVRDSRPVLYFSYEHEPEDLVAKLVALEAGELDDTGRARLDAVQQAFDSVDGGPLEQRLAAVPCGIEALTRVRKYAELLHVHHSTGSSTDLAEIRTAVEETHRAAGAAPMIVVDYLQKVPVPGSVAEEAERTTTVVAGLKDLAIDTSAPVLAIAAADKEALGGAKRMRANHLRGSSALAYEADVVLVLSNKYDIVARHHLTYNLGNAERFREWAVVTVEKNRFGRGGIELEYRMRFNQGRFESEGGDITEQLIDDRVFTE